MLAVTVVGGGKGEISLGFFCEGSLFVCQVTIPRAVWLVALSTEDDGGSRRTSGVESCIQEWAVCLFLILFSSSVVKMACNAPPIY